MTQARSGKSVDSVTLDALRSGDVDTDDVRIHPDTLRRQADVAAAHGNSQLAENLLRAAELALRQSHRHQIPRRQNQGSVDSAEAVEEDSAGPLAAFAAFPVATARVVFPVGREVC